MTRRLAVLSLLVAASAATAFAAEKKGGKIDAIWVHPGYADFGVQSIAMIQPASYDRNLQAEKLADQLWGASLRGTGYRWIGSGSTGALLGRAADGDSLLQLVRTRLLDDPRPDSASVVELCRRLRTDAVLTLRIDRWEKSEIEFNQAGKPTTTVQLRAALVDSSGALLWSASGSETADGPYHDPSAGVIGVKSSGLGTQPLTGQGGAPSYLEVMNTVLSRWVSQFPARVVPATPPAGTP